MLGPSKLPFPTAGELKAESNPGSPDDNPSSMCAEERREAAQDPPGGGGLKMKCRDSVVGGL